MDNLMNHMKKGHSWDTQEKNQTINGLPNRKKRKLIGRLTERVLRIAVPPVSQIRTKMKHLDCKNSWTFCP